MQHRLGGKDAPSTSNESDLIICFLVHLHQAVDVTGQLEALPVNFHATPVAYLHHKLEALKPCVKRGMLHAM